MGDATKEMIMQCIDSFYIVELRECRFKRYLHKRK